MVGRTADQLQRLSCGSAVAIVSLAGGAARASYEKMTIERDAFVFVNSIRSFERQKGKLFL